MASEFEIIDNPTSTPEAVSTGYQAQNTNLVSQRAGLDLSVVEGGVGQVTVKIAGPVDVNGVLYVCKTDAILTPADGEGRYVIRLNGSGDELTPELVTDFGTFDPEKNARYDASGHRILNWIIFYDGTDCIARRFFTPETSDSNERNIVDDFDVPAKTYITASGTWTAPFSKYYEIEMCGRGGNGGNSDTAASGAIAYGGNGGGASYGRVRLWIEAGDIWTATFSTSSGGNLVFTDGAATLSVQNGFHGTNTVGDTSGVPGDGGGTVTGFNVAIVGSRGANIPTSGSLPTPGGFSFLSSQNRVLNTGNPLAYNGATGNNYGGGGQGAGGSTVVPCTGGAGGSGVIIITG